MVSPEGTLGCLPLDSFSQLTAVTRGFKGTRSCSEDLYPRPPPHPPQEGPSLRNASGALFSF